MRPDSLDLRDRVAAAVAHHDGAIRRIARAVRVRTSFIVRRLRRRRAAGTRAPEPRGGGPPPALGPGDRERRAGLIRGPPHAPRERRRPRGGFTGSLKTRGLAWRRRHLTSQKKGLHARRRDRPAVPETRRASRRKGRPIEPKRRGFGDETGVTTAMTPAAAWAGRGVRAVAAAPATWGTVTVIAAVGRDGVGAPRAFPGATDTTASQTDVDQVLVPALHAGDVVVRDNLTPHRTAGVAAALEDAGARGLPLPPYGPDDTPIEARSSKVERWLRRAAARAKAELNDALGEALRRVTPEDILGWFRHAGLGATHG